jgi:hypothetical protein
MRLLRASTLLVLLAAATCLVAGASRDALVDGWRVVGTSDSEAAVPPASDLAALLTGGCALLLAVGWLWFAAAVTACTWEALRAGPVASPGAGSSLLRPRLVTALVASFVGVTAFAGPAQAQSPAARVRALPDDLRPTAVSPVGTTLMLLEGLPVPDRATGRLRDGGGSRAPDPGPEPVRRLQVAPGDSLWSLTAGLLPTGASAATVASGWRLLYAANRTVIGPDPDLLRPGQTLRIAPALEALMKAARAAHPVHHHAGDPR